MKVGERLATADIGASERAARPADDPVGLVLEAVSWLGRSPQSRLLPPAIVAAVGASIGPHAAAWQLASWGAAPFGTALKHAVGRRRPPTAALPLLGSRSSGPSFPSTHVLTYTGFHGCLAWLLVRRRKGRLALLPAALVALVGPSRLRAGDHWLSDVLAGYVLGAAVLAILIAAARSDAALGRELTRARRRRSTLKTEDPEPGNAATTEVTGWSPTTR